MADFEREKKRVIEDVNSQIRRLRQGSVELRDLVFKVELREDPQQKAKAKTVPQAYQAATLLLEDGNKLKRGDQIEFVKVKPFKYKGRRFSVKPVAQAKAGEIDVEDYVRSLVSSLAQAFEPMGIDLKPTLEVSISDFL
jgi:DNA polymerase elongation subunit (family B)